MKVELSKREIEVILELMEYGSTFLFSHGGGDYKPIKKDEERININDLKEKLKRATTKRNSGDVLRIEARAKSYQDIIEEIRVYIKPNKYIRYITAGKWILTEDLKEVK